MVSKYETTCSSCQDSDIFDNLVIIDSAINSLFDDNSSNFNDFSNSLDSLFFGGFGDGGDFNGGGSGSDF